MLLSTRGLKKKYGKLEVLTGLSLGVDRGVYGFLGRNGAGKTTALRIVMGLVKADAGDVVLFGETSKRRSIRERQRIGYVSQEPTFYPWMTASELGRFVSAFYQTWDASLFARLLQGFDVPPDRKASLLSGGTRAKLGLALALSSRPHLLILDEPTAGLDPVARREFLDLVVERSKSQGHGVIFSSHLVEEIERIADRVGILEGGRLLFEGAPAALLDEMREVDLRGGPVPDRCSVVARLGKSGRTMLRAPADVWVHTTLPAENVHATTLEEAFLALVSRSRTSSRSSAEPPSGVEPNLSGARSEAERSGDHGGVPAANEAPPPPQSPLSSSSSLSSSALRSDPDRAPERFGAETPEGSAAPVSGPDETGS